MADLADLVDTILDGGSTILSSLREFGCEVDIVAENRLRVLTPPSVKDVERITRWVYDNREVLYCLLEAESAIRRARRLQ